MRQRPRTLAFLFLVLGTCLQQCAAEARTLTLRFHPVVGAEPLVLGEARYANPGGDGRFLVRDFRLFLSNIRLLGAQAEYAEPDSYHLVRFDGEEPGFQIVLREIPSGDYTRIEFGIGVDPAANGSLAVRGDLDPNGRMAWNWEVGYKFVLMEGTLLRGETQQPLVYHVGFNESYRVVSSPLGESRDAALDFQVDLLAMLSGKQPVDMAALPTVKFDRADAARLAASFPVMIRRSRIARPRQATRPRRPPPWWRAGAADPSWTRCRPGGRLPRP